MDDLLTEPWIKQTDESRAEIAAINQLPALNSDFLQPCTTDPPALFQNVDDENESWLVMKTRIFEDAQSATNSAQAKALKKRLKELKKMGANLYERNRTKNSLERLPDEAFEVVDDGWKKLREVLEKKVQDSIVEAKLELIEQDLYKENLLVRYWKPLATKYQSVHGISTDLVVKNFPIPKCTAPIRRMQESVHLMRMVEQHLEEKEDRSNRRNRRSSVKEVDMNTVFASGEDFAKQTIRLIAGSEEAETFAPLFNSLYTDDVLSSRMQRVQQIALLRQCGLVLKETFNKRFYGLHQEKSDILMHVKSEYNRVEKRIKASEERTFQKPPFKLFMANDENPGHVLYQVSTEQLLQYMDQQSITLPFFLDARDLNYPLIEQAARAVEAAERAVVAAKEAGELLS